MVLDDEHHTAKSRNEGKGEGASRFDSQIVPAAVDSSRRQRFIVNFKKLVLIVSQLVMQNVMNNVINYTFCCPVTIVKFAISADVYISKS